MDYRIIIGLEVHVQLLTRTKLFCGCRTEFGLPPNSSTCPVCLGLPGALPVMNRRAFELSLRAATALNCEIAAFTKWDRKNYYYPDLPKNYQISKYELPFSRDGWLEIEAENGPLRVGIIRVHLEEDAGKMMHDERGRGDSLVDLNRAGTPLLEIVSKPELSAAEDAKIYLEEIRLMMRELGVSDCEMQEGSLRCDANVNIRIRDGDGVATPIVEVKNLNSFRSVERAIRHEAQRQYDEFRQTGHRLGDVPKATAGWDDERGVTVVQRRKEEAADYRYFPDPDLVPVTVDEIWKNRVRAEIGELPSAIRSRLRSQFGLSINEAELITRLGRPFSRYFEKTAIQSGDAKAASNWITNQVLQTLNERKLNIDQFPIPAAQLADLIQRVKESGLNMQRSREVYGHMLDTGSSAAEAINALGFLVVADENELRETVRRAMAANTKAVADYRRGKTKAADAIKGAVMRETKGLAKTEVVQRLLQEELAKETS
jgi:aspartyl-tRNA(Asn)/glutamyl-tRNA(Gln) amidotransferase subunit B